MRAKLLIPLILLLVGIPAYAGLKDFSLTRQARGFHERTDTVFFTRDLSETAERINVRVKLKVKKGAVRYRLEDPHGKVIHQDRVPAEADVVWKDWFRGKRGEWRLVLTFDDATGRYSIKMSTR